MESAQEQIAYVFKSRIIDVTNERRIKSTTIKDLSGEYTTEIQELGWFISIEGSHEKLFVGFEKPHFKPQDKIKIAIMRDNV